MRLRLRTMSLAATLAMGVFALVPAPADAGCCGGGGSRGGGYGGGHTFGRATYAGNSGGQCGGSCSGTGMSSMRGNGMAGMNMGGSTPYPVGYGAAPAAAVGNGQATTGRYLCPMHPSVVSSVPGSCPYCGMALTRR